MAHNWSSTDKDSDITLSLSDSRASQTSNGYDSIAGEDDLSSGKWYWEVTTGTSTPGTPEFAIGIINDNFTFPFASYLGSNSDSVSYYRSGQLIQNGSLSTFGSNYLFDAVIGVALDADTGKVWFSKDGIWQNSGDPANGTNEAATLSGNSYRPAGSIYYADHYLDEAFNETDCVYSAPTGFNYLDGEAESSSSSSMSLSLSSSRSSSSSSLSSSSSSSSSRSSSSSSSSSSSRSSSSSSRSSSSSSRSSSSSSRSSSSLSLSSSYSSSSSKSSSSSETPDPYAWSPTDKDADIALSNGNTRATKINGDNNRAVAGEVELGGGKWYWEVKVGTGATRAFIGVVNESVIFPIDTYIGALTLGFNSIAYCAINGETYQNNYSPPFGATFGPNDVIGVALDTYTGKVWFSKNGTWQGSGDPANNSNEAGIVLGEEYRPAASLYYNASFLDERFNEADCDYSAPSGFFYLDEESSSSSSSQSVSSSSRSSSSRSYITGKWDSNYISPEAHILSNRDRTVTHSGTSDVSALLGLPSMNDGRWYWEVEAGVHYYVSFVGVANSNYTYDDEATPGSNAYSWAFRGSDSVFYHNNVITGTVGSTWSSGDIIMVAMDIGRGMLWFGKNGSWLDDANGNPGDPANFANPAFSNLSDPPFIPIGSTYYNLDELTIQGDFYDLTYQAPTGFIPLDFSFSSSSSSSTSVSSSSRSSSSLSESSSSRSSSSLSESSSSKSSSSSSSSRSSSSSSSRSSSSSSSSRSSSSSSSCKSSSSRSNSSSSSFSTSSSSSSADYYNNDTNDGWLIQNSKNTALFDNDRGVYTLLGSFDTAISKWRKSMGKLYWEVEFEGDMGSLVEGAGVCYRKSDKDSTNIYLSHANTGWYDEYENELMTPGVGWSWAINSWGMIKHNFYEYYDPDYKMAGFIRLVSSDYVPENPTIAMFAIDLDNGKFWMGVNGYWWNGGDPNFNYRPTVDDDTFTDGDFDAWIYIAGSPVDVDWHAFPSSLANIEISACASHGSEGGIFKSRFASNQWKYACPDGYVSPLTPDIDISSSSSSLSSSSRSSFSSSSSSSSSYSCYANPWFDDFTGNDGDRADPTLWVTVDSGRAPRQLRIKNNKLRFDPPNDSTLYTSYIESRFDLSGDFDIEVWFDIEDYVIPNGAVTMPSTVTSMPRLAIYKTSDDSLIGYIERFYYYHESFVTIEGYSYQNAGASLGDTQDWSDFYHHTEGALRINRNGQVIYGTMWKENMDRWGWEAPFASDEEKRYGPILADNFTGDCYVRISVDRVELPDARLTMNIDNFLVYSADVVTCDGSYSLSSSSSSFSMFSNSCSCSSSSRSTSSSSSSKSSSTCLGFSGRVMDMQPSIYYTLDDVGSTAHDWIRNEDSGDYYGTYTQSQPSLINDVSQDGCVLFTDGYLTTTYLGSEIEQWSFVGFFSPSVVESNQPIVTNDFWEYTYVAYSLVQMGIDPDSNIVKLPSNKLSVIHEAESDKLSNYYGTRIPVPDDFDLDRTCYRTVITGSTELVAGETYMYAVTSDGNTLRLYLNGVLEGEAYRKGGHLKLSSSSFAIAKRGSTSSGKFVGKHDDFIAWSRCLSYNEVMNLANYSGTFNHIDGRHWGYNPPSPFDHQTLGWDRWLLKGTSANARYTSIYGDLLLRTGDEVVSEVVDFGDTEWKAITLSKDDQGSGIGSTSIQIRGSSTTFVASDSSPTWQDYTGTMNSYWRYVQVKITAG